MRWTSILRAAFYGWPRLEGHERSCIDSWLRAVQPEAASVAAQQLRALEVVQRASNKKLVLMFIAKNAPRFQNCEHERTAAVVALESGNSARVVTHDGQLSSLEFARPPGTLDRCLGVDIRADLMSPARGLSGGSGSSVNWAGWTGFGAPPDRPEAIARFLAELGFVPHDLPALLAQCNGFARDGALFLGTHARNLVWPDRTLVLLAEREPYALAVTNRDARSSTLWLVDGIDESLTAVGQTLAEGWPALTAAVGDPRSPKT